MIARYLTPIFRLFRKPRYWYAVKHERTKAWLVDVWPMPEYSIEFGASVWYDAPDMARLALVLHGLNIDEHVLVRLNVQPNTNHYAMKEIPW